jgi:hypothetical protein
LRRQSATRQEEEGKVALPGRRLARFARRGSARQEVLGDDGIIHGIVSQRQGKTGRCQRFLNPTNACFGEETENGDVELRSYLDELGKASRGSERRRPS